MIMAHIVLNFIKCKIEWIEGTGMLTVKLYVAAVPMGYIHEILHASQLIHASLRGCTNIHIYK